jgi:hypothetical protein
MDMSGMTTAYTLKIVVAGQNVPFLPNSIVTGSDGKLYIGGYEAGHRAIGVFTTAGNLTAFVPPSGDGPGAGGQLTLGPDGNVWYTGTNHIGSLSPGGTFVEYKAPGGQGQLNVGPDGHLWFADGQFSQIGNLDPKSGKVVTYSIAVSQCSPQSLVASGMSLILRCVTSSNASVLDVVDLLGNQTQYQGLPGQFEYETLLVPPTGLPLVSAGNTLAAFDAVHATSTEAMLPVTASMGPAMFGGDGRIWALDPSHGMVDAISLSGTFGGTASLTYQDFRNSVVRPTDFERGADGAIWFTDHHAFSLDRINPNGTVTRHKLVVVSGGRRDRQARARIARSYGGSRLKGRPRHVCVVTIDAASRLRVSWSAEQ